ncbi:MAG: T9SS type A sorting domain-containing protein [Bacteroidales bacterium]|nr:T9SS type A sorting domain-containing protein [Bacteroidales bacterium]
MKKLLSIFILCLGCFGILGAQNIWRPLNLSSLLGVNAQGDMFCTNIDTYPSALMRSQDDGETWEPIFTESFGNFAIGNKGRIFLICDRIVNYSDDNGDTWQQTAPINEGSGYNVFNSMEMRSPLNDTLIGYTAPYLTWTLDGGATWDSTRIAFMEDHLEISDLLVNENGDVYISVWYFIWPNIGIYHSTLSDMRNWELVAFEDIGVKDMTFDPEGNIVCGVYFGGDFSGFEHVPGFYAFWANRVGVSDNGIVYKTDITMNGDAVLAYSLDHGEHFYNTVQNLPLSEPAPGGEDGFLSIGQDNHLYFFGNGQYWKSIPDANDIPSAFAFPSEWYYEIEWENGGITYQHLECVGDTTIGTKRPKIIVRSNTHYDRDRETEVTHEYVYEENNIVYWWNKDSQEFTTLYDLNAEVGDEWEIKVGTESLTMHVDAVESLDYEGKTYRMLRMSDAGDLFSGNIVCGIGHQTSFFPERLMNRGRDFRVEGLRCYWVEDALLYHNGDDDCDAIYDELHGVDENGPSAPSTGSGTTGTLSVYPNPANNVLFVQTLRATSLPTQTYRITNLMGQTLLQGCVTAETQQINIESLPEGIYFISVGDETLKFVKR